MPLTQEQIVNFTTKAKAAGASDEVIMQAIARKKAAIDDQDRTNQAAQAGVISPDKAFELGADVNLLANKKAETNTQQKQPLLDAVNDLLKSNTGGITGNFQIGDSISNIPANFIDSLTGRKAQSTKNIYDQLQGMLSLDNISKLKGTGAISDAEFKVLSQAASRLGRNLSDTDFRKTLEGLQTDLGGSDALDEDDEAIISKYRPK